MGNTATRCFFKLILAAALFAVSAGVQAETRKTLHNHEHDHVHEKKNSPGHCVDPGIGAKAALKELRPLAEKGDAQAQFKLGFMYDRGNGVPQDFQEAASWYRKAAEQGNAPAQFYLGQIYDLGKGVEQDYKEAAIWYSKAAEQKEALAQLNLGFLYEQGQGVPVDMVQAYKWYSLAAIVDKKGNKLNAKALAQGNKKGAEAQMTPEEIKEARALTREWLAQHK